jgi:lactoylglutathione lyase
MHYLHAMVRIENLERALDFYVTKLGLIEVRRSENEKGRYTNIFLRAPGDDVDMKTRKGPVIELTYNWDPETYAGGRNFGHLAYGVENIYDYCKRLQDLGVVINRPPRDGTMAFIRSPEGISIELLQIGEPLALAEPWQSMPNTGEW